MGVDLEPHTDRNMADSSGIDGETQTQSVWYMDQCLWNSGKQSSLSSRPGVAPC